MRPSPRGAPWRARHPPLDRAPQQPVPRRVKLNLIYTVAEAIVRAQDRLVALGPAAALARLHAAGHLAGLHGLLAPPAATLTFQRLAQRQIGLEQVQRLELRWLVEHLTLRVGSLNRAHRSPPGARKLM